MQGEAAQSRRREAVQARQREAEAEARACLEHAVELAKTEAAAAATRLRKLTGDPATLARECDLDELRRLAAELDASGAKVRRAVLDAEAGNTPIQPFTHLPIRIRPFAHSPIHPFTLIHPQTFVCFSLSPPVCLSVVCL